MNAGPNKFLFVLVVVIFSILLYGFFVPNLVSAESTPLVLLGFCLIPTWPWLLATYRKRIWENL